MDRICKGNGFLPNLLKYLVNRVLELLFVNSAYLYALSNTAKKVFSFFVYFAQNFVIFFYVKFFVSGIDKTPFFSKISTKKHFCFLLKTNKSRRNTIKKRVRLLTKSIQNLHISRLIKTQILARYNTIYGTLYMKKNGIESPSIYTFMCISYD